MENETYIYGVRAVIEALQAGKAVDRIFFQKGLQGKPAQRLQAMARKQDIRISYVPPERLNRFQGRNHQGVVATVSPVDFLDYQALIDQVVAAKEAPLLLLLDGVSDVRNLGAIIRTAECTGVDGIILPASGSAPVTADTVKTSAGAVFNVPLAKTPHMKDAVYYLQACSLQVVAASEKAEDSLFHTDLAVGTALVMGSEGKGVSPAVLKMADRAARLPVVGSIGSLNVSVACGVFLYEALRQRSGG
jgi:23S rRNA (guanosine2251-2'-O)-methyltransferase